MILKLLADEASTGGGPSQYMAYVLIAIIVVLMVAFFVVSGRKNKKLQKQYEEEMAAITIGTKVKTIGGICGIVREVCSDNTFVIETGSEEVGKSFVKIDKNCIANTDIGKGETPVVLPNVTPNVTTDEPEEPKDENKGTTDAQS